MTEPYHEPVMADEVIEGLKIESRQAPVVVDMTLGGGGHAAALLARMGPDGALVGLDRDEEALEAATRRLGSDPRFRPVRAEFGALGSVMAAQGLERLDAAFMDLGVSSRQLDSAERGFSFRGGGPLDMRMDRSGALTAARIVNEYPEAELADLIYELGEERRSRAVAAAIVRARAQEPILTTDRLAGIVAATQGRRGRIHPATRTFMALRMAVNDELGQLRLGLGAALGLMAPGAALAVLTYHSIEDRIVKRSFAAAERDSDGGFKRINKKVITPGRDEVLANPRARSAKLRLLERTQGPPGLEANDEG